MQDYAERKAERARLSLESFFSALRTFAFAILFLLIGIGVVIVGSLAAGIAISVQFFRSKLLRNHRSAD